MRQLRDTTVVLRHCGERTTAAAASLLRDLVSADAMHSVSAIPFSACLRQSLQCGIDQGRTWTLCIDADVLVEPASIVSLCRQAARTPNRVMEIQGVVFDKFFCIARPAGNHLYRTEFLGQLIDAIPVDGSSLRPESDAIKELSSHGYRWQQSRTQVGVHDFEQYYRDIYRKCFLQAHKHREYLAFPQKYWQAMREHDADFAVASQAVADGLKQECPPSVAKDFADTAYIDSRIESLGLTEKSALSNTCSAATITAQTRSTLPHSLGQEREAYRSSMHELFFGPPTTFASRASMLLARTSRWLRFNQSSR